MENNVISTAIEANYLCDTLIEELTDGYKETHWKQYPHGTKYVYSYLESRGGKFDYTVFFGLQYYLKRYLEGVVITDESIDEAINDCEEIFGFKYFNEDGWRHIAKNGGKLPLEIKAVPEGTPIQTKNVLMTVVNTDPVAYFLPNFFEGLLEMVWYPSTVATISREVKKEINGWAVKTGEVVSPVHLNDFGFRGTSSPESAGIGGMAHLVNFAGSDTLIARRFAKQYYHAKSQNDNPLLLSVYAAEHSTVTSYGEEHELNAYRNILAKAPNDAIVSIVIDSYDAMRAVDQYFGNELKDQVLARNGKTVLRPDSGDPKWMSVEVLESLWKNYGGTINAKGYKVLDPHVGVIYGDYISLEMIKEIMYEVVHKHRFAPSNIVFGMGGALLQKVHRDTQSFAFKCSAININDQWHDVYKRPISDARKESKRGRLALTCDEGIYTTVRESCILDGGNVLQTVFLNGNLVKDYTFDLVRFNARLSNTK